MCFTCVTWLDMCDVTLSCESYVWHDSFICVTWLTHMCDTYAVAISLLRVWFHICDMTHTYVWRDMTYTYVNHDSVLYVTWRIRKCEMTHAYVWHTHRGDQLVADVLHMCDMTWHVWCDSVVWVICVTWLIHMCYTWTYQSWLIFKFVWTCSYGVATVSWSIKLQVSFAE